MGHYSTCSIIKQLVILTPARCNLPACWSILPPAAWSLSTYWSILSSSSTLLSHEPFHTPWMDTQTARDTYPPSPIPYALGPISSALALSYALDPYTDLKVLISINVSHHPVSHLHTQCNLPFAASVIDLTTLYTTFPSNQHRQNLPYLRTDQHRKTIQTLCAFLHRCKNMVPLDRSKTEIWGWFRRTLHPNFLSNVRFGFVLFSSRQTHWIESEYHFKSLVAHPPQIKKNRTNKLIIKGSRFPLTMALLIHW